MGMECCDQESYCTLNEAAQRLGVHSNTVRRWIEAGALKAGRFRSRWRISLTEVERVAAAMVGSTSPDQAKV